MAEAFGVAGDELVTARVTRGGPARHRADLLFYLRILAAAGRRRRNSSCKFEPSVDSKSVFDRRGTAT
jgi:hypothetical protein